MGLIGLDDVPDLPPATCRLSEEHGLGDNRHVQIALDFGHRIEIARSPLAGFYVNLSLDEAKVFAAELDKQIKALEG